MDENLGISYILEKKECVIDGKNKVYYQIIDVACGFIIDFNRVGKRFVSLSKQAGKELVIVNDPREKFVSAGFKSLFDFCRENNNTMDIPLFIKQYSDKIGEYKEFKDNFYYRIDDEKLIRKIKQAASDYDETVLNNKTDISQMYSSIKKTIISQDEQIMQILTTLFKNQKVINSALDDDMIAKLKENLIIYGSTGTGKTEILKRISKLYNVPIVIEDSTSLSETGYVGRSVNDMLDNLYLAAGKDVELAQKGILVIDEFDKLAEKGTSKDHVSRIGVQRSLLKLLDGTMFYVDGKKFDTSKLSIVALGAFTGISNGDDYSNVKSSDFVDYGIMRELMGRFSKMVHMNSLTKEDIKKILTESNFSPLNTYKELFNSMNIKFSYDMDFVDYIAEKTVSLNSGARSIKTVFDNEISGALFRIFAGDYSSIRLVRPQGDERSYILDENKNIKSKKR